MGWQGVAITLPLPQIFFAFPYFGIIKHFGRPVKGGTRRRPKFFLRERKSMAEGYPNGEKGAIIGSGGDDDA